MVELRRERWGAARASCERALKLNDQLPRAWNDLGVALSKLGEPAAALDAWQRAVDLDGSLLDALWNLGTNAAGQGRPDQARRALAPFLQLAPAQDYPAAPREARRPPRPARASPPPPLPPASRTALLPGLLPGVPGAPDTLAYPWITAGVARGILPYLPLILKKHGYATGGAVSAYVLQGRTGLATGFDLYE